MTLLARPPGYQRAADPVSAYERHKRSAAQRQREISAEEREIAHTCPAVRKPQRRAKALKKLQTFLETYLAGWFYLDWSEDQLKVIAWIERIVRHGGQLAIAMPRASGKTRILVGAVLWALLNGHHRVVALIAANQRLARALLKAIVQQFQTNELLYQDFPVICHVMRAVKGAMQRRPLWHGEQIYLSVSKDELVLPWLDTECPGAAVCVFGLTGAVRGVSYEMPDGSVARPTLALLDDPQTRKSARSAVQNEMRGQLIAADVMGLAGPGQPMSAIMACTVIVKDDLADKHLDREQHPEWNGIRTKMLYSEPLNKPLWAKYYELVKQGMQAGVGLKLATEFYREHQKAMDSGAKIAWPARYNPDELSAVQHAMTLRFKDPSAFASEYQNEPLTSDLMAEQLRPEQIVVRVNNHARGRAPIKCEHTAAGFDTQGQLLYWAVVSCEPDATPHLIDYGTWPDQAVSYFTLRNAPIKFANLFGDRDGDAQLFAAIQALIGELAGKPYIRDDSAPMPVGKIVGDARWKPEIVYSAMRQSQHFNLCLPAEGVDVKGKPMAEWTPKPGEIVGEGYRIPPLTPERTLRKVLVDSNHWIGKVHSALSTPVGVSGAMRLFEAAPHQHQMLAEHICAEYFEDITRNARPQRKYHLKPGNPDNHLLDAVKLALMGCYILGARPNWAAAADDDRAVVKVPAHMLARRR